MPVIINDSPFEIIAAPATAWIAQVGSTFPSLAAEPGPPWILIGTSGDLNYLDEGVVVRHLQSIEKFRPLGSPGPIKAFRNTEDMEIQLTVADLSLEQYQIAMSMNEVTAEAGVKTIGMNRGLVVSHHALLVRFPSPYGEIGGEQLWAQYEVPVAIQEGEPEVVFRRSDTPASLELRWSVMVNPNASSPDQRFGVLRAQYPET